MDQPLGSLNSLGELVIDGPQTQRGEHWFFLLLFSRKFTVQTREETMALHLIVESTRPGHKNGLRGRYTASSALTLQPYKSNALSRY